MRVFASLSLYAFAVGVVVGLIRMAHDLIKDRPR